MAHIEEYADLVAEHFTDVKWDEGRPGCDFQGTRNGVREDVHVFVNTKNAKTNRQQVIVEVGTHMIEGQSAYVVALHSGGYQIWRVGRFGRCSTRRPEFIAQRMMSGEKVGGFVLCEEVSREEAKEEVTNLVPDALAGVIAGYLPPSRKVDWARVRQNWWNHHVHLHYLFLRDLDKHERWPEEMPEVDYTRQRGHEIIHAAELEWRNYAEQYRRCKPAPLIPALPPVDDNSFCACF